jgi:hypothetical protein
MGYGKNIVLTAYGHNAVIDKISLSSFDSDSDAGTYCDTINNLELNGDTWVLAKTVPENTPFSLNSTFLLRFDTISELDASAIQKILRQVDSQELAKALKDAGESTKEKIFSTMSKNAVQMLKEDMEYMGPIRIKDVRESQEKIVHIIRHLEQAGEIVLSPFKGDQLVK